MGLSFKDLFRPKKDSTGQNLQAANTISSNGPAVPQNAVAQNQDWKQTGFTEAGTAQGNISSYRAGFQSCFQRMCKSQQQDQQLQEQMKARITKEKISLEGELSAEKGNQESLLSTLDTAKEKVASLRRKLNEAQHGIVNKDKTVRLNFLIGVVIVALLTVYLFIFYSSTAYSAFFRDFDAGDNLSVAMFDGNAVVDAFRSSFFEGCFCLFMPVIFLALGYVAYGFSSTAKGVERYFKTLLLYLITFAFDFLMAYKISKAFYNIEATTTLGEMPPYSLKLAMVQEDFWIVIFCGFVSYVIWGLAFSFVMSSYDKLTNNKYTLEALNNDIADANAVVGKIQQNITASNQNIAKLGADIKQKEQALLSNVQYDYAPIKQALADHYQGWAAYLSMAKMDTSALQEANKQEMDSVQKWMNKE